MFVGCGEEISWGQRIIGFSTPETLNKINVQHEFTLHNIEIFNGHYFGNKSKTGLALLLCFNFLYKLFWLGYCIILPIACLSIGRVFLLSKKIRLPLPPLAIGIFFLINWLIFRITLSFLLPTNESLQYYSTIGEIRECASAFIFAVLSYYFFKTNEIHRRI